MEQGRFAKYPTGGRRRLKGVGMHTLKASEIGMEEED